MHPMHLLCNNNCPIINSRFLSSLIGNIALIASQFHLFILTHPPTLLQDIFPFIGKQRKLKSQSTLWCISSHVPSIHPAVNCLFDTHRCPWYLTHPAGLSYYVYNLAKCYFVNLVKTINLQQHLLVLFCVKVLLL